jgi:hypothetical protein
MRWFPLRHINLDALLLALAIVQITLILAIAAWGLRRRYLGDKAPAPIFRSLCGAALALFVSGTLVSSLRIRTLRRKRAAMPLSAEELYLCILTDLSNGAVSDEAAGA